MTMKYAVRLTDPENFTFGAESGSWDHVKGWLLHELRGCARESRADGQTQRADEQDKAAGDLDALTTAGDEWSWTFADGATYELFKAPETEGGQSYKVVVAGTVLVDHVDRAVARQVCALLNETGLLRDGLEAWFLAEP